MIAILRKLGKFLPSCLGSLFGDKSAEERRHEKEMAELDALKHGKVTPGYLAKYVAVFAFAFFAAALLVESCWPDAIPGSPAEGLEHLVDLGVSMLQKLFGM